MRHRKSILSVQFYLVLLLIMTIAMVTIGGITRHTDSGLSITDWRLVANVLPPSTDAEWNDLFDNYKGSSEYRLQNSHMQLSDFKEIYWWEWIHRQSGRMIGVVWLTGFLVLILLGHMTSTRTGRILVLGSLGLAQGLIGWWMVRSGLEGNMVDVASYRLAIHLLMAFLIIGLIWWYLLLEQGSVAPGPDHHNYRIYLPCGYVLLLLVQTGLGALVAGIDAGSAYPTWPLMDGALIPDMSSLANAGQGTMLENPALVHFLHRMVGYGLTVYALLFWWFNRSSGMALRLLAILTTLQMVLGIATVLSAVDHSLALVHQSLAIMLLLAGVTCLRNSIFHNKFERNHGQTL